MSDDWKLEGHYFESCTCDLVCPCIFLMPPTKGYCEAFIGWHIEKGHMGDTDLSGLNVAAWLHAPGLLTDGGWKLVLYIDDQASDGQKNALQEIYGGKVGGHPAVIASLVGEVLGVHSAGITLSGDGKCKTLKVESSNGSGEMSVNALEGEDGGAVIVRNHPLAVAPGNDIVVHKSVKGEYNGHGNHWRIADTVSLASAFQYQPE